MAIVIEDTADIALVFQTALEQAGFETEIISNGSLALTRLTEAVPDLILLDLHLPEVSGEQILKYVRSDTRFDKTKVVLATADSILAEKLTSASTITLQKPISFTQLRQLAERLKPRSE